MKRKQKKSKDLMMMKVGRRTDACSSIRHYLAKRFKFISHKIEVQATYYSPSHWRNICKHGLPSDVVSEELVTVKPTRVP